MVQVDLLLMRLTVAWNESKGTLNGGTARAAVTSVRMRQRMCIATRHGGEGRKMKRRRW